MQIAAQADGVPWEPFCSLSQGGSKNMSKRVSNQASTNWFFWHRPRVKRIFWHPPERLQKGSLGDPVGLRPWFAREFAHKIGFWTLGKQVLYVNSRANRGPGRRLLQEGLFEAFLRGSKNRISREDGTKKSKKWYPNKLKLASKKSFSGTILAWNAFFWYPSKRLQTCQIVIPRVFYRGFWQLCALLRPSHVLGRR